MTVVWGFFCFNSARMLSILQRHTAMSNDGSGHQKLLCAVVYRCFLAMFSLSAVMHCLMLAASTAEVRLKEVILKQLITATIYAYGIYTQHAMYKFNAHD